MARLQILELPTIERPDGTEETPFVLVIDQYEYPRYTLGPDQEVPVSEWDGVAEKIGARQILVFNETVDIPANETPVDPDGYPLKIRVEGDFERLREQVQDEILYAQGKVTRALGGDHLAQERTEIARDADRLAKWKNELTDALGMDRTRDWDDIRNAATGLRKERDAQAETLERVRNLSEQPEVMDAQHPDASGYLHGYGVAIRDAKRASYSTQQAEPVTRQTPRGPRPGKVIGSPSATDA